MRAILRRPVIGLVLGLILQIACVGGRQAPVGITGTPPDRLTDSELWQLSGQFSEAGGTFHSENYISNENEFQRVIPDLVTRAKTGQLYLGVGPEQNFSYIAALRPRMVFIVDIRRGNLLEHLLYKAFFELSATRAEFLSRLFARTMPASLGLDATVDALFLALSQAPATEALFARNLEQAVAHLTKTHGFALSTDDLAQLETIYRVGFVTDGPYMMYRRTDGRNAGRRPTYAELMTREDGAGNQRSYLAEETSFAFLKNLHERNLLVPVVGDFGGPKALRAVGTYARTHGMMLSAFYLSNVEQYLRQDGKYQAFCASVASMPIDDSSTFIRSQSMGGSFRSLLGEIQAETEKCS